MTIDVTKVLTDYEGNALTEGEGENQINLTFRHLANAALNNVLSDEVLSPLDKKMVFELSIKLWATDQVTLTLDEVFFLKERASRILPALWYGRVCETLEASVVKTPARSKKAS